ncbi:diacylglycerol kinase [Philodulcilactobacillus myokoensis]|uniref:Diacylglycerol kinase n=1 Tax=Philodulcilactobacillus myokoensis TaxID=2929573 RepID=A0A9W6B0N8_9LACO|nr:diacylglycerol kinase [Philodulcilactobacillus myokoensis]GLB46647.1 diacylglycerol kinase [Philodulcilactobacillus myokoensis]
MRKRARVIYNPTSGREILKSKMIDILNVFEQAGYETSAYATTPKPHSARDEAKRAVEEGFDLIVAAGGDGTINEVVNGIAPQKKRPKFAIIPAGTTNDFARALHIPRNDPIAAAKIVLKKQTFKMDVGQAGKKYFINIAGGGLLTELTYDVPSDLKTVFGYLAYLVRGAELLPQIHPIKMDLEYDGGKFDGKASMFLLAMTNSIGGLERIVPDASLNDGEFTMIIVKTSNLVQILQLLTKVINGKHINDSRIIYKKTKHLIAKPVDDEMQINLDGEYGGNAPMEFKNLKQHIEIYANLDKMPLHSYSSKYEQNIKKQLINKVDKLS